ncbi:MAG: menaquinone biosynthesis protein [Phycisphaerae bacterium]|nr:menaquinone biosynthesis protein [Phycisphaerae bacterium]
MPSTLATRIRLGAVSYLNTLPLIEGLGKLSDISLTLTAPSRLIDLLLNRHVDLALASIIDVQRSPEPLVLIPVGMIGSDASTLTVRLFSRTPIAEITTVHADIDSHTSIALLRVLLAETYGRRPAIIDFDAETASGVNGPASNQGPSAILLIGDKVIANSPSRDDYPHQLDLGEAWRSLTGKPFVYAAWMCRESDADAPAVRAAAAVLDRQRRHNATRLPWIAAARAPSRNWPVDLADEYLQSHLRFTITPEDRASIDEFFRLCRKHAVLDTIRPVRWLDLPAG